METSGLPGTAAVPELVLKQIHWSTLNRKAGASGRRSLAAWAAEADPLKASLLEKAPRQVHVQGTVLAFIPFWTINKNPGPSVENVQKPPLPPLCCCWQAPPSLLLALKALRLPRQGPHHSFASLQACTLTLFVGWPCMLRALFAIPRKPAELNWQMGAGVSVSEVYHLLGKAGGDNARTCIDNVC